MRLHDLIEEARRLYYEGGTPMAEAAAKVVTADLPPDELHEVLLHGFIQILRRSIRGDRQGEHSEVGGEQLRPAVAYKPTRRQGAAAYHALARIHYETPGGVKSLLDFTVADCRFRAEAEARVIAGAERRVAFFAGAAAALQGENRQVVGRLSRVTLEALNVAADEAFGRAEAPSERVSVVGSSDSSGGAI